VDKWLWYARFFKTRSFAAVQVSAGHVRLNAQKIHKPAQTVSPGDVLTFAQGRHVRVIQIDGLGTRRGPAVEAQALYTDLSPGEEAEANTGSKAPGFDGKGRPTGRDRRKLDLSRTQHLE